MSPLEVPTLPGSYRWYYVDVSNDEWSAVVIFMVGSLFSRRYVTNHRKGVAPTAHAAVNFALYRRGERVAWVLSEYDAAHLSADGTTLDIGASRFTRTAEGAVRISISDRTPWLPRAVEAELTLTPETPECAPVTLVDGLSHQWFPFCVRAKGQVRVPSHGVDFTGRGYHDGNAGQRVLGTDLPGWSWIRTHHATSSEVVYQPDDAPTWHVTASATDVQAKRDARPRHPSRTTGWGLTVPAKLGVDAPVRMLESSPFYARMEATAGDVHTLGEAGDFARFHSPLVRWMADFRTRVFPSKPARGLP
jgi:carotenoid 1,2-hydratase